MIKIKQFDDPGADADVMAALLTATLGERVTEADVLAARAEAPVEAPAVEPEPEPVAEVKPKAPRASKAKPEPVPEPVASPDPAPSCVKVIKSDRSVVFPGVRRPGVSFGDVYSGAKAAHLWAHHREIVRPFP